MGEWQLEDVTICNKHAVDVAYIDNGDGCPHCDKLPVQKIGGLATIPDFTATSAPKKSSGRGKHIIIDGIEFDSVTESNRYLYLKLLQGQGIISNLARPTACEISPQLVVQKNPVHPAFKQAREVYTPDLEYDWNGIHVIEDVKSHDTTTMKKNHKLVPYMDSAARNKHKKFMQIVYSQPNQVFLLTMFYKKRWRYFFNGKKELVDFSLENE